MTRKRAEKNGRQVRRAPLTSTSEAFAGWATDDHVRVGSIGANVRTSASSLPIPDGKTVDLTDDKYEEPEAKYQDENDDDAALNIDSLATASQVGKERIGRKPWWPQAR